MESENVIVHLDNVDVDQLERQCRIADEELSKRSISIVSVPTAAVKIVEQHNATDHQNGASLFEQPNDYIVWAPPSGEELDDRVEYDLESDDERWLFSERHSRQAQKDNANESKNEIDLATKSESESDSVLCADTFEVIVDRLEKRCYALAMSHGAGQDPYRDVTDESRVCLVCLDGECWDSNQLVFCDGCDAVVHQECYGLQTIPDGSWFCVRCALAHDDESPQCVFCPNSWMGAMKPTDDGRLGHVSCAMWLPEPSFGDAAAMEPIVDVARVPPARWRLRCVVCKRRGACIQCSQRLCTVAYHVTCAIADSFYLKLSDGGASAESYCPAHTPLDCIAALVRTRRITQRNFSLPLAADTKHPARYANELFERRCPLTFEQAAHGIFDGIDERAARSLFAHWRAKRQARCGMPLLRRLLPSSQPIRGIGALSTKLADDDDDNHDDDDGGENGGTLIRLPQLFWRAVSARSRKASSSAAAARRHSLAGGAHPSTPIRRRRRPSTPQSAPPDAKRTRRGDGGITMHRSPQMENRVARRLELIDKLVAEWLLLKARAARKKNVMSRHRFVCERRVMAELLCALNRCDRFEAFCEPVDAGNVPDYHDIVKQPMSFARMKRHVDQGDYAALADFEAHLDLIVSNALLYNAPTTEYAEHARQLGAIVERMRPDCERGPTQASRRQSANIVRVPLELISSDRRDSSDDDDDESGDDFDVCQVDDDDDDDDDALVHSKASKEKKRKYVIDDESNI
jgi:bromodomain and PHD finger-containing protein 3